MMKKEIERNNEKKIDEIVEIDENAKTFQKIMTSITKIKRLVIFATNFRVLTIIKSFVKSFRDNIITTNFCLIELMKDFFKRFVSIFVIKKSFVNDFDEKMTIDFCKRFDNVDVTTFKTFSYFRIKFIACFNSNKFFQTFFFSNRNAFNESSISILEFWFVVY